MPEQSTQSAAAASNPFWGKVQSTAAGLFGVFSDSIARAGSQAIPIWVNRKFGSDQDTRQLKDTTFQQRFSQPRIEDVTFAVHTPDQGGTQKVGFTTGIGVAAGLGFAALLAVLLISRK